MNRNTIISALFIVALGMALVAGTGAYPKYGEIYSPQGAQYVWDGNYWRPLSGTASGSIGVGANSLANTTVYTAPAASAQTITSTAGRNTVLMVATQSFVFSVGTTTIPTTAAPVISAGCDVDAGVPIAIQGANAATVAVTVYQFGR